MQYRNQIFEKQKFLEMVFDSIILVFEAKDVITDLEIIKVYSDFCNPDEINYLI